MIEKPPMDGLVKVMIQSSAAYNYYSSRHTPDKAYDSNVDTAYAAQDGNVTINWIKFSLGESFPIKIIKIVGRIDSSSQARIDGTKPYVHNAGQEVAYCGEVTGSDSDPTKLNEADQTFYLDCGGAVGDTIYMTDVMIQVNGIALNIAEVEIYTPATGLSQYLYKVIPMPLRETNHQ